MYERQVYDLSHHGTAARIHAERPKVRLAKIVFTLAVIAVVAGTPLWAWSTYGKQAVDLRMKSALHNVQIAMEAFATTNRSYKDATLDTLRQFGLNGSPEVEVEIVSASIADFTLRACADGGTHRCFRLDSFTSTVVGESSRLVMASLFGG